MYKKLSVGILFLALLIIFISKSKEGYGYLLINTTLLTSSIIFIRRHLDLKHNYSLLVVIGLLGIEFILKPLSLIMGLSNPRIYFGHIPYNSLIWITLISFLLILISYSLVRLLLKKNTKLTFSNGTKFGPFGNWCTKKAFISANLLLIISILSFI